MAGGHQQPQEEDWIRAFVKKHCSQQSELPLSILWNSVEFSGIRPWMYIGDLL